MPVNALLVGVVDSASFKLLNQNAMAIRRVVNRRAVDPHPDDFDDDEH
jgi:hypothetical protein